MSHPVITIHPKMSLHRAISLMKQEFIRRLPVVIQHGKLVGIISETDLKGYFWECWEGVKRECASQHWYPMFLKNYLN